MPPEPRNCRFWATGPLSLHGEVFRLRVMDDDRRGRLFGIELVLIAERDPDLVGAQQLQNGPLIGEVRAGRVAEGIAAAAITLVQHLVMVTRLLGGKAQFAANALV